MAKRVTASRADTSLGPETRVCVLHGTDPMLKRLRFEALREVLESARGDVDVIVFDAATATLADVLDECRSLSLLGGYKLVVVDGADQFVSAHRDAMERYAKDPADQATLVLRSERWNRGKLDKLIDKVGGVLKCEPLSAAQAKAWLGQRAQQAHGRAIAPAAAGMLVDRLGRDLMRLDNELAKLSVMAEGTGAIQPTHVQQLVGRSSDEQAWAVQEAVLTAFAGAGSAGNRSATTPGRSSRGGQAIEKIHELVDQAGQADVLVAYFVADLIRKLYLGTMMHKQGAGPDPIAQRLKLWGSRRAAFLSLIKRVNEHTVGQWFDQIVRFDAQAKSGLGKPMRNLECFCAWLADEIK